MELFVLAILLSVTGALESQLEGPQNTASVVGSTVTLKCSSPSRNCSGIDWQTFVTGYSPITVFKGPGTILSSVDRDRYSVDNSSGCDLIIKNVQLKDAGRFICSAIISSSQMTKTAYLVIILEPNCTTSTPCRYTMAGDEVQLNCVVTYTGSNRTSINWKGVTNAPAAVYNGNTISRLYSVVASEPMVPSFTCEISFAYETHDSGVAIGGLATNSVSKFSCATSAIKVLSDQQFDVEGPENTLTVVGSTVTMKCSPPSTSCRIEWLKYSTTNSVTIFNDRHGISSSHRDRYSVDNSTGYDLVIKNVQLTDAGRFICSTLISRRIIEKSAYLTISEAQPKCSIYGSVHDTVEGEGVQLNCIMRKNEVNTIPMIWKGVDDAPALVQNGKTLTWSYYVVASAPEVPAFTCISSLTFQTKYTNGTKITGLADNIPNTTCETSAIKVIYSVRNVQLSPSFSNYPSGSRILCKAKGHPAPNFKWQEIENYDTWMDIQNQNDCEFITPNVSSKWYRCVAMNAVRGQSYSATSHEFVVNNTESDDNESFTATTTNPSPSTVVASVAAGVSFICLLFILPINCFFVRSCPGYNWWHSRKKSEDTARNEYPLNENPDLYSSADQLGDAQATAKPRSVAPTSEPPSLPKIVPPKTKPRMNNPETGRADP